MLLVLVTSRIRRYRDLCRVTFSLVTKSKKKKLPHTYLNMPLQYDESKDFFFGDQKAVPSDWMLFLFMAGIPRVEPTSYRK